MKSEKLTKLSLTTRLLHWLIVLTISFQLVASLIRHPRLNPPENFWFEVHEKVGLVSLGALFLFWIWALVRQEEKGFADFFPWLSPRRIGSVFRDAGDHIRALASGKLPSSVGPAPLASAVHGIGLIIATALAVTGTIGYFNSSQAYLIGIHEALVVPMWIYLVGHAGMATVHQFKGEGVFGNMFSFRRNRS